MSLMMMKVVVVVAVVVATVAVVAERIVKKVIVTARQPLTMSVTHRANPTMKNNDNTKETSTTKE